MFKKIYVPVDNSEYSNQAAALAVKIGAAFQSTVIGSHVYAAAMHDYRFKQMEFTLPGEYLQEEEIERQRKIHDSLITMGLELISDCYLNPLDQLCKDAGIVYERRMIDGKHHLELVKDIEQNSYDLTVIGVLGIGKNRDSQIGSVCERVVRQCTKDVLVVKHIPTDDEPERQTILVGIDGSPHSFGALLTAMDLAQKFNKRVEVISVYDPYLHYVVFNGIVDVLTEKAAKVFRFEEQNQLHEEIIDTGLAQIYQSHLNISEKMAQEQGLEVTKTLLDGKAFHKILGHVRKDPPWLLVLGRVGVHKLKEEEISLGSTTENVLRLCPCNILISTRFEYPELDRRAEESILWTAEAEARMKKVPDLVRGIARRGILRLAIEQGHSVITDRVIDEAMDRFMPKHAAKATTQLAEAVAFERAREGKVAMCTKCGVTAADPDPQKCSVCGASNFEIVTPEIIEKIISAQEDLEDDVTYDGRDLKWSKEARTELNAIVDKYQRRRAKARIEKSARMKKLTVISFEFARHVIDDDIGREIPIDRRDDLKPLSVYDQKSDLKLIAKDENGVELRSAFYWQDEAGARLLKVPAGFMRDQTQKRIENLALERRVQLIDLELVDEGLAVGRKVMEQLVSSGAFASETNSSSEKPAEKSASKCPFASMSAGADVEKLKAAFGQAMQGTPSTGASSTKTTSHVYTGVVDNVMNEAGIMQSLQKERDSLK